VEVVADMELVVVQVEQEVQVVVVEMLAGVLVLVVKEMMVELEGLTMVVEVAVEKEPQDQILVEMQVEQVVMEPHLLLQVHR
jgi:hypothetical protein